MQRDSNKSLRYAALQSDAGKKLLRRCGRAPDDISSIVLVEPDACFIKSEAVLRIAQLLDQPFPALASSLLPLPGILRDAVYDQVHAVQRIFTLYVSRRFRICDGPPPPPPPPHQPSCLDPKDFMHMSSCVIFSINMLHQAHCQGVGWKLGRWKVWASCFTI